MTRPTPLTSLPDTTNYVLGTQTFGVRYQFTKEDALRETARQIVRLGSNVLKITIAPDSVAKQYPGVRGGRTPLEVVRDDPAFRDTLAMPFSHILLWVYTTSGLAWQRGMSMRERRTEYRQMRELCDYLLETYECSGKRFYLGHWEGDWHLRPDLRPDGAWSETRAQGMIDWLNTRQRAVEDARRRPRNGVALYNYVECNLVQIGLQGKPCLSNQVLPHVGVDAVSYSSYDSLSGDASVQHRQLTEALDFIESHLPAKGLLEGDRRVWLGEYGFPMQHHPADRQMELSRQVARTALTWGCPFALYWEMYCNEVRDGRPMGFWMIDDKGVEQPVYTLHARWLREMREWVRRNPSATREQFRKEGVKRLDA